MNVLRETDEVLELEHVPVPWIIGLGAVVIVLAIGLIRALVELSLEGILISLVMLAALSWIMLKWVVRRLRVVADRGADTLRIIARTPLGEGSASYPLSALLRAEIETRHERNNSTPEQALVLVMDDASPTRRVRLDPFRPDTADLLQACARINAWLAAGADISQASRTPAPEEQP
jgi:hypothetical protein